MHTNCAILYLEGGKIMNISSLDAILKDLDRASYGAPRADFERPKYRGHIKRPELMPKNFKEFIGQERVKAILNDAIISAQKRGCPMDHTLLSGLPGVGKTTLAYLIADTLNRKIVTVTGGALEKPIDIFNIFKAIEKEKDPVLFIDEIHSIRKKQIQELLFLPMEVPGTVINMPSTFGTLTLSVKVPPFTIIGATTGKEGMLEKPLLDRFTLKLVLDRYNILDIQRIILQSAKKMELEIEKEIAFKIAERSCLTPRIANNLLRRIRDYIIAHAIKNISKKTLEEVFKQLGIDELGLDDIGRKILIALATNVRGALGLRSLATKVHIDEETLKNIYEPQLLINNLIDYMPKGRSITESGLKHIKRFL